MALGRAQQRGASPAGGAPARGEMRRGVGFVGLLFISVGSIIGSGWLLGALGASERAGPASVISWGLGAVVVVLLALVYAELGPPIHWRAGRCATRTSPSARRPASLPGGSPGSAA